jgi:hypothetical protein
MLHRVADLHGAGVGAQQVGGGFGATFHIKGVVHGTRGWSSGVFRCGEVEPVRLDLGALGHIKSHRAEDGLDALHRQRHGVQTTLPALAAWQCHVERFGAQLRLHFGVRQSLTAVSQRSFNGLFGEVDGAPRDFFSSTVKAAMPFINSVMRPDLPRNSALAFSRSAG